ncbi:MAG TPA: winged helix DNA-binding domain-containing protein [Gaiellaceae bacterium]|nr:winged helix DNA-binding domain-containing protein [Gaiellaceae bacterium]
MAERVLTLRELNRTLLLRQLLLQRASLSPVRAIERLAGLQAQFAPAPYLALWARLEGFRREALERALRRDAVLKATLIRATLHLVSARDYPYFRAAVGEAARTIRTRGTEPPSPAAVRRAVALAREQPRTRRQLYDVLGYRERVDPLVNPHPLRQLHWLLSEGRLEQTAETAMWEPARVTRFRALQYELPSPVEGRAHVIRRYLSAFGPASRADLASWSGVPRRELDPALEAMRLRTFRDESGRVLLDLPRAPLAAGDEPAPPRLLAPFDEIVLAHKDRTRIIGDDHRPSVIWGSDVASTFSVDGFVAGTWRRDGHRVVLEPFDPLPRSARRELEDEARRLEAWLR